MGYLLYFVLTFFILGMIYVACSLYLIKKKTLKMIKADFGAVPDDLDRDIENVKGFYSVICRNDQTSEIDSTTWNDLEMDMVFNRINACRTSLGEAYLYAILHKPDDDMHKIHRRENFIAWLSNDDDARLDITYTLTCLGKEHFNGLHHLYRNAKDKLFKHPLLYKILAFMPFIGALALIYHTTLGVGLFLIFGLINVFIYYYYKLRMDADFTTLHYASAMLLCAKMLARKTFDGWDAHVEALKAAQQPFKPITGMMARTYLTQRIATELQIVIDIIKQIVLYDVLKYLRCVETIARHQQEFQTLYEEIGEIDAAISIMSFRASLPFYCKPDYTNESKIVFEDIFHPLLSHPVTNSGTVKQGSIITGSNASGKSTFIKALAINGIFALTINTCCAHHFITKPMLVMTSMAVKDNIAQGESYFITEIKSLKRILDVISKKSCVCYIDEILKGTNAPERISASVAILQYLAQRGYLCIIASHDIELTQLLDGTYDDFHFSEKVTPSGVMFDYKLHLGATQTRNAILLLEQMGFDKSIIEAANHQIAKRGYTL